MVPQLPHYRRYGKLMSPLEDVEFINAMETGRFVHRKHRGFTVLLYYSAVRRGEALKTRKEQLTIQGNRLYYDVRTRLKHSKKTAPLPIPLDAPYVNEIIWSRDHTNPGKRIWPYCDKTAYNIVERILPAYPHFFRLSRITNFFKEGWTIAQVQNWTGLSLNALNYYVGLVDIDRMGASLK